jgi:two-component system sensor histidine kinase DesK
VLFAGVWLVFLVDPLQAAWEQRATVGGWVGGIAVLAFAAVYIWSFAVMRQRRLLLRWERSLRQALLFLGAMVALGVLACVTLGQSGTATAVYVAVTAVMWLPGPGALATVTVLAVLADVSDRLVPGWDTDNGLTFAICAASFAMWGVNQLFHRNLELMRARDENADLAVTAERSRFARDLHDILGHSLTVITVKAELAGRLLDVDPERARAEIADLERLSRDALADVRRAVEGYRDLTLPGELVRARNALTSLGIAAEVPGSADEVPGELRELFAWTVREGVTNVIRHSGAQRCTVTLTATSAEVRDDGRGCPGASAGSGLAGLRERAEAVGARVVTRSLEPGFALQVVRT